MDVVVKYLLYSFIAYNICLRDFLESDLGTLYIMFLFLLVTPLLGYVFYLIYKKLVDLFSK